jgi:hypothetical protein
MRMSPEANALEPVSLPNELAPRFIALNRLAEAIRSHTDEQDLFRTLVSELREVVEFDVLCQLDGTAKELPGSSLRFATLAQRHGSLWAMFPSIERRVANEETIPDCSGPRSPKSAAVG